MHKPLAPMAGAPTSVDSSLLPNKNIRFRNDKKYMASTKIKRHYQDYDWMIKMWCILLMQNTTRNGKQEKRGVTEQLKKREILTALITITVIFRNINIHHYS